MALNVPTAGSIIRKDYLASSALVGMITLWLGCAVAYAATRWIGQAKWLAVALLIAACAATAYALPVIVSRVRLIQHLLAAGATAEAEFRDRSMYKDHVRIRYSYRYQGSEYQGSSHVASYHYGGQLEAGAKLPLLIDPRRPGKSVLLDVYREQ